MRAALGHAASYIPRVVAHVVTFASGIVSSFVAPASDAANSFQIRKADKTTSVVSIDTSLGNVGIGVTPTAKLDISGQHTTTHRITAYSATYVNYQGEPQIDMRKSHSDVVGTLATTQNGETLGSISFNGVNTSSAVKTAAAIRSLQDAAAGTTATPGAITFLTLPPSGNLTERVRITSVGNTKIAGTAVRATTEGTNHLDIFDGTAPVGTLANGISIYSESGECYIMDAAGNATLQSPHDDKGNWIFYSENTVTGRKVRVDMEKMMRRLNDLHGWNYFHEEQGDTGID